MTRQIMYKWLKPQQLYTSEYYKKNTTKTQKKKPKNKTLIVTIKNHKTNKTLTGKQWRTRPPNS